MRKEDSKYTGEAFRSHRIHFSNDSWWVSTREGERGPFPTKALALTDAKNYVRREREKD